MANINLNIGTPTSIYDKFCAISEKNKITEIQPNVIFSGPEKSFLEIDVAKAPSGILSYLLDSNKFNVSKDNLAF